MNRTGSTQPAHRPPPVPETVPRRGLLREFVQVVLLYGLTLLLFSWIFPPDGIWPLALVCLVPWAVASCRTRRAWLVHWLSFLFGWGFYLINLRWLDPVTREGYVALGFYLALYWPLCAWALRTGQRHGLAPVWVLPIAWIATEYLRAWVMTGFPWLFLAHAFYAQLPLIQISDLTGAYGVSLLAGLVNGLLATLLLRRWPHPEFPPRRGQLVAGAAVSGIALAGTLAYGYYRLGQVDFAARADLAGPRVAVVQHDFPLISTPPYGEAPWVIFAEYLKLGAAAAAEKPDLLVFPETVWAATQNLEFLAVEHNAVEDLPAGTWQYGKLCHEAVAAFARGQYGQVNEVIGELERRYRSPGLPRLPPGGGPPVTVVVGATSVETFPEATYPRSKKYNSALVYDRDGTQRPQRYDKNHLVPFGEVVPFRYGRLHWLYRRLNALSPFSYGTGYEYSLTPGRELTVFSLEYAGGTARFGTPICYEDVMPKVIRRYAWAGRQPRVDFLVNISNDGWFLHGDELPQHLASCAFRAVENRVGIARAVNTGISGFIDPNGRIYDRVEQDGRAYGPGVHGWRVAPVYLDQRGSFYARAGDWLPAGCLVLTALLWVVAVSQRWILAIRQRLAAWRATGGSEHAPSRRG